MNKNALYLSVFAVLCVLAGVLVGVSISKATCHRQRFCFREKAENFMGHNKGHSKGRGDFTQMLTDKLGLSQDQKLKVTEILENARQEIDKVGKAMRSSILIIKEKGDKQIMDILTPQQQEKFKTLQEEFKKRYKYHRKDR